MFVVLVECVNKKAPPTHPHPPHIKKEFKKKNENFIGFHIA
jgi:hypothetical protein